MKKFIILFLAITDTVFTTSCSDDDEVASASIQGNWKLTAESEGGVALSLDDCELEQTAYFAAAAGSLVILDDDTPPCTYETLQFTYVISGTNIEFNITGIISITAQGVIEELTANSLRFRIISDSINGPSDPEDITVQTYVRL
jgi:hypothetical protein